MPVENGNPGWKAWEQTSNISTAQEVLVSYLLVISQLSQVLYWICQHIAKVTVLVNNMHEINKVESIVNLIPTLFQLIVFLFLVLTAYIGD